MVELVQRFTNERAQLRAIKRASVGNSITRSERRKRLVPPTSDLNFQVPGAAVSIIQTRLRPASASAGSWTSPPLGHACHSISKLLIQGRNEHC